MRNATWLGSLLVGAAVSLAAANASAQMVHLRPGFAPDPMMRGGTSGGPLGAQQIDPQCRGFVPNAPQQRMMLHGPMGFLRIWVQSSSDTTLMVRGPDGRARCADDTYGNNPAVDLRGAPPGLYEVYVGSYAQGAPAPYSIAFTQNPGSTPGGMAMNGPGMPPGMQPGIQPGIQPVMPPGPPMAVPVAPSPMVAVPPPMGGAPIALAPGFMPDPRVTNGVSGGPVPSQSFGPQCRGWFPPGPSQSMYLTAPFGFLRVFAAAGGDTTLAIRSPSGQVFCADDTYGNNPGVDLRMAMPGQYQVYVGSYSSGMQYPFSLTITQNPGITPGGGPVAVPVAPPPPPMGSMYGTMALQSGFMPDPRMMNGVAGGPISAQQMNGACRGYIPTQPNHVLYLNTPFNFLRVYATSQTDTTLMIRTPSGQVYCADDTYGFNPGVDMQMLQPGPYQVFVGTYSSGNQAPYSIGFTELPYNHP